MKIYNVNNIQNYNKFRITKSNKQNEQLILPTNNKEIKFGNNQGGKIIKDVIGLGVNAQLGVLKFLAAWLGGPLGFLAVNAISDMQEDLNKELPDNDNNNS